MYFVSQCLPSIHPSLHLVDSFFIFLDFDLFLLRGAAHALEVDASSTQQNGVQQLVHSAPTIEKKRSYVAVTLKTMHKSTIPREFPDYWWLIRTQQLLRYSARLVEERKKEEEQFRFLTVSGLLL